MKVALDLSDDELLALLRHDSDPFNRWQAAQTVAMRLLTRAVDGGDELDDDGDRNALAPSSSISARQRARRSGFRGARARSAERERHRAGDRADVDPDAIHAARTKALRRRIGARLAPTLAAARARRSAASGAYSPDAASAGRRALRNGGARPHRGRRAPWRPSALAAEQFARAPTT